MKQRTWVIRSIVGSVVGVVGLAWIGLSPVQAGIGPVGSNGLPLPIVAGTPTVVLLDGSGRDVTGTWLPEPGQPVTILINVDGVVTAPNSVSLVFDSSKAANPIANNALTTSAYPGECTNFPSHPTAPPDTTIDFALNGNTLTPNDCGGMAVILVNGTNTFILPQDSNFNGLPDIWEAKYPPIVCFTGLSTSLAPGEDKDCAPVGSNVQGDGFTNFDEYRGFMVSPSDLSPGVVLTATEKHIRTDPRQKDLFVHLANPQCIAAGADPLTSPLSLIGGGTTTFVTGDALFGNIRNLIPGAQIHVIGYTPNAQNFKTNQWIDLLDNVAVVLKFGQLATVITYRLPDNSTTTTVPLQDRQINQFAIYKAKDSLGLDILFQRGLRLTECVVDDTSVLYGDAGYGSPNGPDNTLIFTKRIAKYVTSKIGTKYNCAANKCLYQTYNYSTRTWSTAAPISQNDLTGKLIAFYVGMEIGHAVQLTTTLTSQTVGHHTTAGSGDAMDQAVLNKTTSTTITFQIPSSFSSSDQAALRLKD
jgi:hypothetical protein